jgi:mevalonate kinase
MYISRQYPAKILLFGEYGILLGSHALSIPCREYNGALQISGNVRENWQHLISYLIDINHKLVHKFDLRRLKRDIKRGLYFNSSIPFNYGLGSSGALVAALFENYCLNVPVSDSQMDLDIIKSELALIESYFHGQSSGLDPLVSLYDKKILVKEGITVLPYNGIKLPEAQNIKIFLVDSGFPAKTSGLVNLFTTKLGDKNFRIKALEAYLNQSDSAIDKFLSPDQITTMQFIEKLSMFQYEFMKDFIPEVILKLFKHGLESGEFYMKLCGSAGGGMFLCFTTTKDVDQIGSFKNFKTSLVLYE